MTSVIEREIERIERRIFEILEHEGIKPEDAITSMHKSLSEGREAGDLGDNENLSSGYPSVLLGVGMVRYMVECEPENPEIAVILSATSEAVGFVSGINAISKIIKDATGCDNLNEAFLRERTKAVKALASRAAGARHAENREIAGRIQSWYAENHHRYRSKDAAAQAVTRIEPVAFKTARKHIGAASKILPYARKE